MKNTNFLKIISITYILLYSSNLWAHSDFSPEGLVSGFLHPIFGLDHFLAMLAVGILSSLLGGYRVYSVPAVFVASMVLGGISGISMVEIPFMELGIASSVFLLGFAIIFMNKNTNSSIVIVLVILFGFLHGYAHGLEMPKSVDPIFYAFGFLLSTSLIHVFGVLVGYLFIRFTTNLHKYYGIVQVVIGAYLIIKILQQ